MKQFAPKMYEGLAAGATEAEIEQLESKVGHRLPDDVRASLRRHNGQRYDGAYIMGGSLIPECWELLSVDDMLAEWQGHREIEEDPAGENDPDDGYPGVKPFFLHAAWIPFAKDVGGNSLCVDLDPADDGIVGQIIEFDHEDVSPSRIASDFRSLMTSVIDGLEAGTYVYDPNPHFGGFRRPENVLKPK